METNFTKILLYLMKMCQRNVILRPGKVALFYFIVIAPSCSIQDEKLKSFKTKG